MSPRRILAVAWLTVRTAVRRRLLAAVAMLLVLCTVGLPLLIRSNGDPETAARLVTGYTLGSAFGILALATLVAACAAIGTEFEAQTLTLTRLRPVRAIELWLGRWLAIVAMDAVLLALVVGAVGLQATRRSDPTASAARAWRSACEVVAPDLPPLSDEVAEALARNPPPPGQAAARRRQLERDLPFRPQGIPPGKECHWIFEVAPPLAPDTSNVWIRLRFEADMLSRTRIRARCTLGPAGAPAVVGAEFDDFTSRELELALPAAPLAGHRRLELAVAHVGGPDTGGPLLIAPRSGLHLLVPRGSLAGNLARTGLSQLSLLAVLAALGLTLGTLFSLPVAAFSALGLLTAIAVALFVTSDPWSTDPDENAAQRTSRLGRAVDRGSYALVAGLATAARPAMTASPVGRLVAGERIPGSQLSLAWIWNGLAIPSFLGALAATVLARREERP